MARKTRVLISYDACASGNISGLASSRIRRHSYTSRQLAAAFHVSHRRCLPTEKFFETEWHFQFCEIFGIDSKSSEITFLTLWVSLSILFFLPTIPNFWNYLRYITQFPKSFQNSNAKLLLHSYNLSDIYVGITKMPYLYKFMIIDYSYEYVPKSQYKYKITALWE